MNEPLGTGVALASPHPSSASTQNSLPIQLPKPSSTIESFLKRAQSPPPQEMDTRPPLHPTVDSSDKDHIIIHDNGHRPYAMPQPHRASSSYQSIKQPYLANVKIELPTSPDLVFPPHRAHTTLGHNTESFLPRSSASVPASSTGLGPNPSSFPSGPFNFMADYSWPPPSSSATSSAPSHQPSYSSSSLYGLSSGAGPYSNDDDYDDEGDLTDMNVVSGVGGDMGRREERAVRKRSSKGTLPSALHPSSSAMNTSGLIHSPAFSRISTSLLLDNCTCCPA
jgi:hypothetical protein